MDNTPGNEFGQSPFYIGKWLVDPASGRIRQDKTEIKLEPKVMEVLVYLAQRPGKVITRENLEQDVWTGTVVGYDAQTATIIKLRKALGDDSRKPKYIETVPKKGYRLIADVGVTGSHSQVKQPKRSGRKIMGLILVGILLVVTSGVLYETRNRPVSTAPAKPEYVLPEKPSIAVLPFSSISNKEDQSYFVDGITADLNTDLSRISGLYVIAQRSTRNYKGKTVNAGRIGQELGVKYIVEGSVQKSGADIRVNVRLIDTESEHQLWAERYDRKLSDIFKVQDDIRNQIVSSLKLTLTTEEHKRIARRYTASLEAYEIFLKAQSFLVRQTRENNKTARSLFLDAIEKDPGFARAYSGLSLTHANDYRFHWTDDQTRSAKEAFKTGKIAVTLDDHSPQAHWVLGYIYLFVKKDHDQAIKMGLRTIELEPNHADGLMLLAVAYVYAGEPEKSIALVTKAKRLNPFYPSQYPSVLGLAFLFTANYEASIKAYEESLNINSSRIPPNIYLIASYQRAHQKEAAIWQVEQVKLNFPGFDLVDWARREPYRDPVLLNDVVRDLRNAGLE